jgi:hypothetical protein
MPEEALPVKCTEHGKIMPHYRCAESERWLDERTPQDPNMGERSHSPVAGVYPIPAELIRDPASC